MFALIFTAVLLVLIVLARCTSCRRTRQAMVTGRPMDPFGAHRLR